MKALIWDLDGTLVDSYGIMTDIIYQVMEASVSKEEILKIVKTSSVSTFFNEQALILDKATEELFSQYHALHQDIEVKDYKLIQGVKEIINKTSELGWTHYIFTHRGQSTYDILNEHGIVDCFKDIITIDDGFKRKPSPEALDHLIEKHQLEKSSSYYIGDRSLDVMCANAAGIHSVYFDPLMRYEAADYCINNFNQLLKVLSDK